MTMFGGVSEPKRWGLQSAADYVRGIKVADGFFLFIGQIRRIITFTQERANRLTRFVAIINFYRLGHPVQGIETKYGCSKHTILRYARMAGLPKRPKCFDPKIRKAVISLYRHGIPLAQIQAQLGVSQAYISKTATEEGINRRKFKKRARSPTPAREEAA